MSTPQFLVLIGAIICVAAEACDDKGRAAATALLATGLMVAALVVWLVGA